MKTLIEMYLELAEEYQARGDAFSASYWRMRAFEVSSLESY